MGAMKLVNAITTVAIQVLLLPIYWINAIWCALLDSEGKNLNDKIVLVTGAGNGLGRETTLQLVRQGCTVLGVDIRKDDLEATVHIVEETTKIKGKVHPYICDISDRTAVANLRDAVLKEHGHLDILINNAAIMYLSQFDTGEDAHHERIVNTNILGNLWMSRAFLPSMKNREKGHIVFISSLGAIFPHKNLCIYSATKSAITSLGQCLRQTLESQKRFEDIKVTIVHPSVINTSPLMQPWFNKASFQPLTCEFAAASVINAIRNESEDICIPGREITYSLFHILKSLPVKVRKIFYEASKVKFGHVKDKSLLENIVNNKTSYRTLEQQYKSSLEKVAFGKS